MFWVIMGVSGAGKTTVGRAVAAALGWAFLDADDFHPDSNVKKMRSGMPLTDDDRWPWLDAIGGRMAADAAAGRPAIWACSALRRAYRERLRRFAPVRFLLLDVSPAELETRLTRRTGHYMPASLLQSQLDTLERGGIDATVDGSGKVETVARRVIDLVRSTA